MIDPDDFQFSQRKLQDYVDCPRRFQLRYVLMQPWPALITGDPGAFEAQIQRGSDFHHLVHQHRLGIEPERLAETIHDPLLAGWWQSYLAQPPADLPQGIVRPELVLAAPLAVEGPVPARYRLLAKFDLLAADPGRRLVIVDWKTIARPPFRETLARWLQTRVYRFLAVEAGAAFNGGQPPRPEQVEMVYWFAAQGGRTERFAYNTALHAKDRAYLAGLVAEIAARCEPIWPLTPDAKQCRFCTYRSLCERGVQAGFPDDMEDDPELLDIRIDLEQIAEIEF